MDFVDCCALHLIVNDVRYTVEVSASAPQAVIFLEERQFPKSTRRLDGLLEIKFDLRLHGSEPLNGFYAVAVFPSGTRHYLGPVGVNRSVPSARLVKQAPPFLRVELRRDCWLRDAVESPWPCEMLLKEHVKLILDTDAFCGSVVCSHMQNLVRALPCYTVAMRRFRNWSDFVCYFHETYRAWGLAVYSSEQHELLELSELVVPGELRMVANKFRDGFVSGDVLRDRLNWRALLKLHLEVTTSHHPKRKCNLETLPHRRLQQVALSPNFRTLNAINIIHYVDALPSHLYALLSPNHPIRVEQRQSEKSKTTVCPNSK